MLRSVSSPFRLAVCVLVIALLGFAGVSLAGVPAQAHDQLVSSSPAEGEELDRQPEWIKLEFSGEIQEVGSEIKVHDGDGNDVSAGEIRVDGTTLTSALPDDMDSGDYTIVWRVVSEDGHPISGEIPFTIKDDGAAGGKVGDATAQGSDSQTRPALGGEANDSSTTSADSGDGMSPAMIVAIIIGAIAAAAIIVALLFRKSKGLGAEHPEK